MLLFRDCDTHTHTCVFTIYMYTHTHAHTHTHTHKHRQHYTVHQYNLQIPSGFPACVSLVPPHSFVLKTIKVCLAYLRVKPNLSGVLCNQLYVFMTPMPLPWDHIEAQACPLHATTMSPDQLFWVSLLLEPQS